ncbi:MAG: glycosyltransferase family 2 protein [archaeon]
MKLSAVIPAYNAEKRIPNTIRSIKKIKEISEIVVADDGSADRTSEISKKLGAKVVRLPVNKGKGAAMREGARAAEGDLIVFIDDSQFEPSEIPILLNEMKKNKADMIVGKRNFDLIPWQRRITNSLTKLAILMGTGKRISDPLSGFRIMPKKAFESLNTKEDRYSIEADINFRAILNRLKIIEHPVTVHYHSRSVLRASALRSWRLVFFESMFNVKTVLKIWLGLFR